MFLSKLTEIIVRRDYEIIVLLEVIEFKFSVYMYIIEALLKLVYIYLITRSDFAQTYYRGWGCLTVNFAMLSDPFRTAPGWRRLEITR